MAEETDTPKPRSKPQVVYLYGAAADRRNKTARRSRTGRVPRQVRLGRDKKTVVRRNRRVPVTLKWLKANREELKAKIAEGLIWVENGSRERAPEEWLKEMGLWTDPSEGARNYPTASKAAYNDNLAADADEDLENTPDDEDETEGLEDDENEDDQDEEGDEPEGEDPEDDPNDDEPMEEEAAADTSEDVTTPTRTGQPLPAGWREFVKKDLLKIMNDRDIPIGDDTRNDTLISLISEWAAVRGLE